MLKHLLIIHLIDVVAGENEHIVWVIELDKADILIDGVGGALVPGALVPLLHIGGQDMDAPVRPVQVPGLSVSNVAVELQRLILGKHSHRVDAGVNAVAQGEIDDAEFSPEGDGWLCHPGRQGPQAASLAACQQHGDAFFLHLIEHLSRFEVKLGRWDGPRRTTAVPS